MLHSANNGFLANVQQRLAASDDATTPAFPYPGASLLYVIDGPATSDQQSTVLNVMYQRRGPGTFNKPKLADLSADDIALAPPSDRRLLALLHGAARRDPHSSWPDGSASSHRRPATFMLPDPLTLELMPTIARSARAWLRPRRDSPDVEPLAWDDGPAWKFRLIIEAIEDGFHVDGELYRLETTVRLREEFLVLAGGLIAMRGALGRFEAAEDFAFLAELRRSGPVDLSTSDGPLLAYLLARSGTEPRELPDTLRLSEVRVPPVPRLSLLRREDRDPGSLSAELSFDYDGTVVSSGPDTTTTLDAAGQRVIHRQPASEAAARARLDELGFRAGGYDAKGKPEIATRALPPAARTLIREGWYVEADGVRYRVPTSLSLSVTSGVDWFDLDASVAFGDMNVALAGILASAKPGGTAIRLGDGSVGLLPEDWIRRYAPLAATGEVEGERIRFRRSQAALLAALLADRDAEAIVRVDETFDLARRELAEFTHITAIEPPASFTGTLRPYQSEGLGWFQFLRRFGFGGCLADDMGLGKTVMVLALLESRRDVWREPSEPHLPSLIVVPRSLVGNWMAEAARFTPGLRVLDYSHALRSVNADALKAHDVVIVTYGTLRRDIAALSEMAFDYIVLDEAQAIKNAATASSKAARLLGARHRLALSGTPIENHLGELWSLFEFLNPGVLGRSSVFQRATAATTDGGSRETTHLLARGLRPFILRRTKQQVAHDLPARTEQTISCQLSSRERALYDSLRRHYRAALIDRVEREGLAKSKMHVLEALLRLRQAACHPGLVDPKRRSDASAKFEVLLPRLREVLAEGHKALVFSQFTTLLGLLRVHLDAEGVQYEYLDGTTKNRGEHVRRFQEDPGVGLFLISLKAGGLGLNLTAAEYVFLLDPWWNPAAEAQAIDRAHRIGQTREVFAYRLIAEQTVEDKVLALQQSKRALADAVLSADAVGLRHLGREDLEWLLS